MKASMPHHAVSVAGSETVSAGSRMTRSALLSAPQIQSFLPSGPAKMLVAEVSEPGDEISRLLGSTPAKAGDGSTVPSFPIAARKPVDQTDANAPTRIQRVTEATIRFVAEQTSDIRVSDSSAKPGSSEIRFR